MVLWIPSANATIRFDIEKSPDDKQTYETLPWQTNGVFR